MLFKLNVLTITRNSWHCCCIHLAIAHIPFYCSLYSSICPRVCTSERARMSIIHFSNSNGIVFLNCVCVCVCALYIIWQSKYRCQQVVECARETRGSTDVCVFIFSGKQAQIVVAHEYFNISIVRFSIENFTHFTHTCWNKKAALWIIHCDFGWLLHSQPSRTVGAINKWSRISSCVNGH